MPASNPPAIPNWLRVTSCVHVFAVSVERNTPLDVAKYSVPPSAHNPLAIPVTLPPSVHTLCVPLPPPESFGFEVSLEQLANTNAAYITATADTDLIMRFFSSFV